MSAEFVANMEDVLDLYAEPYDPQRPVVCFDETSTRLLAETRPSLPPRPGLPLRQDYEYRREGTRNLFLACEPLTGWRQVAVTQRRTMQDFAHQMRWLVDEAYPETPVVRVVMDNPVSSTGQAMAEIEFSVLSRSCLNQRLPDQEALQREVQALVKERKAARATINWRFNTRDARTILHRLYPFDSTVDYRVTEVFTRRSWLLPRADEGPGLGYRIPGPVRSPAAPPSFLLPAALFHGTGFHSIPRRHPRIAARSAAWRR